MVKLYKPRHARDGGSGAKSLDLARSRRQGLYREAGRHWEAFSRRFLGANPECYVCGKRAQAVDHIEPHQGRREIFERTGNHLALCHACHNTVTAKFDRRYRGEREVLEAKVAWMNHARKCAEVLSARAFPRPKVVPYFSAT